MTKAKRTKTKAPANDEPISRVRPSRLPTQLRPIDFVGSWIEVILASVRLPGGKRKGIHRTGGLNVWEAFVLVAIINRTNSETLSVEPGPKKGGLWAELARATRFDERLVRDVVARLEAKGVLIRQLVTPGGCFPSGRKTSYGGVTLTILPTDHKALAKLLGLTGEVAVNDMRPVNAMRSQDTTPQSPISFSSLNRLRDPHPPNPPPQLRDGVAEGDETFDAPPARELSGMRYAQGVAHVAPTAEIRGGNAEDGGQGMRGFAGQNEAPSASETPRVTDEDVARIIGAYGRDWGVPAEDLFTAAQRRCVRRALTTFRGPNGKAWTVDQCLAAVWGGGRARHQHRADAPATLDGCIGGPRRFEKWLAVGRDEGYSASKGGVRGTRSLPGVAGASGTDRGSSKSGVGEGVGQNLTGTEHQSRIHLEGGRALLAGLNSLERTP